MLFRDIIGQEAIKKRLIDTVKNNRLGHAWLFFGPEGSGKLALAIAFARYISCMNRGDSDACGTCPNCLKYNKYIHPDLHFSFPVNKTKSTASKDKIVCDDLMAEWRSFLSEKPYGGISEWYASIELENKQGIINTEESKRIVSKLGLKAYESDYKAAIIWQADKMHDQGANRLLKLIEEPPPQTVFILVSEKPDQILTTIKSRCMQLKIPRIEDSAMLDVLVNRHRLDEKKAENTVRIASGNYQKALTLIEEPEEFLSCFARFRDMMRVCYQRKISAMVKISEELASLNRERQKMFLEYGQGLIRECLAMHFGSQELLYISDDEYKFVSDFSPFINGNNILAFQEELNRAVYDIERNANGKIVFLDMLLTFATLLKRK